MVKDEMKIKLKNENNCLDIIEKEKNANALSISLKYRS